MSEKEKLTKAAGVVGAATLLSRVFGMVRDLVVAYFFGAGMAADAFFAAFRIPNLLRRLLAEGALTVSFIPIFTEYLSVKTRDEAFELARAVVTLASLVLAVVTVLGVLLAPYIVWLFAPGFAAEPDKFALTVLLTRIVFPYIFLVGLVALAMGLLNSLGRFAGPALSPVMLNIGMIASVYLLSGSLNPPILSLAIGVLVGGVLQVLLQIPYLAREKGLLGLSFRFAHPAIKRILLLMGPAAVGAAAYQITILINTLIASFLPEGSISFLYYSDRIVQFPLGVFAVAIATAVLPSMSRQAAAKDMKGLGETLSFSLRLVLFITLPAMVGMIVLAEPIIQLIYQRGRFSPDSTSATAAALIGYAAGLWAISALQVVVRAFYSVQDTKTPVKISLISMLANVVLCLVLMGPLKHVGLALASSGGAVINLALLLYVWHRRMGRIGGRVIFKSAALNLAWSLVMALVVWLITAGHDPRAGVSVSALALRVIGAVTAGTGVYIGLALLCRAPEVKFLLRLLSRNRTA